MLDGDGKDETKGMAGASVCCAVGRCEAKQQYSLRHASELGNI